MLSQAVAPHTRAWLHILHYHAVRAAIIPVLLEPRFIIMSQANPAAQIGDIITGYWRAQAVYVAAKLGLADLLESEPQSAESLAARTDMHPESLYRLLRALASIGIFAERPDGRFETTPLAGPLCSDVPDSQRAVAIMMGEEHFEAWHDLLYSVRTGQKAFDRKFGEPIFNYLSSRAEQAAIFDAAMTSIHGRESAAMLDVYDFSPFSVVVDIGGGNGSTMQALLNRYPQIQGVVFDLPGVIERTTQNLQGWGLASRCKAVAGSFFESIPSGADSYILRHIIHDWTDEQCRQILRNCHRAMAEDARLLIIESVIPPGNEPFFGKWLDLTMLVIPGGKERTRDEFSDLLDSSGFELMSIKPTSSDVSVLEARKRQPQS
jgi:O-methyltransferase/methyltransferase family protein